MAEHEASDDFEREKWRAEMALKERELALKEREGSLFKNPIVISAIAVFVGLLSNAISDWLTKDRRLAEETRQREVALLGKGRMEQGLETVKLKGKSEGLPGIAVGDLSADQKAQVRKVMSDLLAPFRKKDSDEAMKYIEAAGFDKLHMAFYKNQDIGNDGVWDVWQLEGPNMVWYFRGSPHVHVWANIKAKA